MLRFACGPVALLMLLAFLPCRAQTVPVISAAGSLAQQTSGKLEFAALLDADADGLPDLISRTDSPLQIVVQRNVGGETFGAPVATSTLSEDVYGTAFADLDQDGVLDAVVGNPCLDNVNLCIFRGTGAGGFALWDAINNNSLSFPLVALGDLDGDGDGDILSTTNVELSANIQQGISFTYGKLSAPAEAVGVPALGDFNQDGFLDVVQASHTQDTAAAFSDLRVSLGDGTGAFFNVQNGVLDVQAQRTQVVDLDGDGAPDLLVFGPGGTATGNGGLYLFRNNGGTFELASHEDYDTLGALTQDVSGGDLNGDGIVELIVVRRGFAGGSNEVRVIDGFDAPPVVVPFAGPPEGRLGIFGDLDGDELSDVAIVEIPTASPATWNFWHNETPVSSTWTDIGFALAGSQGEPSLQADGSLVPGDSLDISLTDAKPGALVVLVAGVSVLAAPLKGGTIGPAPDFLVSGLVTAASGGFTIGGPGPAGLPDGTLIVLQAWIVDTQGPQGFAASNTLVGVVPPPGG